MNSKKWAVALLVVLSLLIATVVCGIIAGCSHSNHYVFDKAPSVHLKSVVKSENLKMVYLTVSNPTSTRKHFVLMCSDGSLNDNQRIVVPPRSDLEVKFGFVGSPSRQINCFLSKDNLPGSR